MTFLVSHFTSFTKRCTLSNRDPEPSKEGQSLTKVRVHQSYPIHHTIISRVISVGWGINRQFWLGLVKTKLEPSLISELK